MHACWTKSSKYHKIKHFSSYVLYIYMVWFWISDAMFIFSSAALNLGCVPVRASRSERHNNPRSYLPPRTQEPPKRPFDEPPAQPLDRSKVARPDPTSHNFLFPKSHDNVEEKHKLAAASAATYPVLYESRPYRFKEPASGSIYPWGSTAPDSSGLGPGSSSGSGIILVGTPVGMTSSAEASKVGFLQNKLPGNRCDLSLRLGLSSEPRHGTEGSSAREEEDSSLQVSNQSRYFPWESYYHQQSQFK